MKKAVIRFVSAMLILILAVPSLFAYADGGDWDCENCGRTGNTGNFCGNCGAARPVVITVSDSLEQIPGETDRVKVCLKSVEASDYIVNRQDPDKWLPRKAIDGDESTCWQVKFTDESKGNVWLHLNLEKEQTVDEIWFKNGFWAYNTKGTNLYTCNARIKYFRVSFRYKGETNFQDELPLKMKDEAFGDWQRFDLGRHEHVTAVRIVVRSKYKGDDDTCKNDLCLSEAMLVQRSSASGAKAASETKAPTVYESSSKKTESNLLMKLATRTGPGTQYEGPGTFFIDTWQKQTVTVTGKAWDGGTWWVQVDFNNGGKARYRVWTGLKRVDVDIEHVKEIEKSGTVSVKPTKAYCGPGSSYAKLKDVKSSMSNVDFYGWENGYVEIDYYDSSRKVQRRVWVPEKAVSKVKRK